jgi:hypothetical protein
MAKKPEKKKPAAKKKPPAKGKINFKEIIPEELSRSGEPDTSRPRSTLKRPSQLPVVQEKKARTGNVNRAKPPRVIRGGYTPGSASRAVVPYTGTVSTAKGFARVAAARAIGAIGAIVDPNFMNYKSERVRKEEASADKPVGPIRRTFKDFKGQANPKVANPYTPSRKKKDIVGRDPNEGLGRPSVRMPKVSMSGGSGDYRPEVKAPRPKARPSVTAKSQAPRPKARPSAQPEPKAKAPAFKGNWVGAAPSEMQKRGGRKIKKPNLLSLLKGKK